jgi:hypothetical protein
MNKDLASIDADKILLKIVRDQALTKAEAAVGFGLPYSTVKALAAEKGFPMIGTHFFPSDFKIWRRQKAGLLPRPPTRSQ